MSIESEVRADLIIENDNKSRLMQKYSDKQAEIVKEYGGNLSDIPMDSEHEFHRIQRKIMYLGRIS